MSSDLPALLIAILILLSVAIIVSPLAILYAFHAGWIGFQWGVLGLLAALCYFQMLGGDDSKPQPETVFVDERQETDAETEAVGGDERW